MKKVRGVTLDYKKMQADPTPHTNKNNNNKDQRIKKSF